MIKFKIIVLLICFFQIQIILGKDKFDVANENYQKGNYPEAIVMYENILNSKKESWELYYNLANAYYKLNKIAPSIYYYEKAKLLNPESIEIQNNLKLAQNRTLDQFEIVPKMGYGALFQNITSLFHYDTWGVFAIILSFIFLLIFLLYYFNENSTLKRMFFISSIISILLIFTFISFAFFEKSNDEKDQPAIVFEEKIEVKKEPKDNSKNEFTLHEGTKILVIATTGNWSKIYINNENMGWVRNETIKLIKY